MSRAPSRKGKTKKSLTKKTPGSSRNLLIIAGIVVVAIVIAGELILNHQSVPSTSVTTSSFSYPSNKPIILYENQGNVRVDQSNFSVLLSFAKDHHFNTIFFQIYRSGQLLFNQTQLYYFVSSSHLVNLSIFFALFFTAPTQSIPSSIYGIGENGINLDMSTLSSSAQSNLLSALVQNYKEGLTAVTATNFTTTLRPNYLILETYSTSEQSFIHKGIIASVEPLGDLSSQSYSAQFQYALNNSDGIMVFDYYGLLKMGY